MINASRTTHIQRPVATNVNVGNPAEAAPRLTEAAVAGLPVRGDSFVRLTPREFRTREAFPNVRTHLLTVLRPERNPWGAGRSSVLPVLLPRPSLPRTLPHRDPETLPTQPSLPARDPAVTCSPKPLPQPVQDAVPARDPAVTCSPKPLPQPAPPARDPAVTCSPKPLAPREAVPTRDPAATCSPMPA